MKRQRDDAQIIEMVNRCEELILKAKKAAREIEEKVRKELETQARHNSLRGTLERYPSLRPVAPTCPADNS